MARPGSVRRSTSQRRNRSRRKPLALAGALAAAAAAAFSQREAVMNLLRSKAGGTRAEVQTEPSAALQADAAVPDPPADAGNGSSTGLRSDAPAGDTPEGVYAELFIDPADVQPGAATSPSDGVEAGAAGVYDDASDDARIDALAGVLEDSTPDADPSFSGDTIEVDALADVLDAREAHADVANHPEAPELTNYDLSGPAENTATPLPVAPPVTSEIDEEAEIAAAAAEAAAIGGTVSPYSSSDLEGFAADAERPLAESGEGVSEGFEQAEAELVDAATPYDTASPYQRQIDEAIDLQDNPYAGERAEALQYTDQLTDVDQPGDDLGASATGASSRAGQEQDTPGGDDEQTGERWSEHHP